MSCIILNSKEKKTGLANAICQKLILALRKAIEQRCQIKGLTKYI